MMGKFRSGFEKRIDPTEDILIADDTSHALHPRAALGLSHEECFQNRVGHLLDIIRIDELGAGLELLGRAGELAQDEHAIFLDTARAIFLGYEIHSVLERRHEADVASAIVREKSFAMKRTEMILHRQPGTAGEAAVDVANQPIDAMLELVIAGNRYATWHDQLDQHNDAAQFRISPERAARFPQALPDPFAGTQP